MYDKTQDDLKKDLEYKLRFLFTFSWTDYIEIISKNRVEGEKLNKYLENYIHETEINN